MGLAENRYVCPFDDNPDLRWLEGGRLVCRVCGNYFTADFLRNAGPAALASLRPPAPPVQPSEGGHDE